MAIHRECVSDQIRQILEERIVSGQLKPGDRLLELEIAKEFNTSQTPVREALEALNTQRLVESIPYRGTYVRSITNREMQEAYAVRAVLEQLAAELAAPLLNGDVSELRAIQSDLQTSASRGETMDYARHNDRFHRAVVNASRNQILIEAWQNLRFETRVRILMCKHAEPNLVARAQEHDPVIEALAQRDGAAAGRYLRDHAHKCSQRWQARMDQEATASGAPLEDRLHVPASVLS